MTVQHTPLNYSSAHGDLIYVVYDAHSLDSTTYPNYKYIADVYVNSQLVARLKKAQNPTTNAGIFNVGQVVRNYLSTTFNPTASALVAQTMGSGDFYVSVEVKFGEEYTLTDHLSLATASPIKVYNSYNTRLAGVEQILSQKTNKLASARPLTGEVLLTSDYYFVPYFPISGTITVTVTPDVGIPFSNTFTPSAYTLQILNIAPAALNAITPGAITEDTRSYTVQIGSQTISMSLICEPIYTPYTLHFLNRYGGFESKIMQKVSRSTLDITRKDFGKLPYTVSAGGAVNYYSNGVYNESTSVYWVQFKEKLTLNSDLLTDAEYRWLSDLVLAPMVFVQDGAYFYPVTILDNNYEFKKNENDDLTNLTLSIEYGDNQNSQFR